MEPPIKALSQLFSVSPGELCSLGPEASECVQLLLLASLAGRCG